MTSFFARLFGWSAPPVSPAAARRRAARGAAYLDDVDPGWHRRLNLDALALSDGGSCVLGQLHGSFRSGLGRARLFEPGSAPRASLSPVAYGFHCVRAADEAVERRDYALLDQAWTAEVRKRQAEAPPRGRAAPERASVPAARRGGRASTADDAVRS